MGTYKEEVVADTPAAYWRLGEATIEEEGGVAVDVTGANNGVSKGLIPLANSLLTTETNKAIAPTTATTQFIEGAGSASLEITTAITIEFLCSISGTAVTRSVMEKTVGGVVNTAYRVFISTLTPTFRVKIEGGAAQDLTGPVLKANETQYVTITYDSVAKKLKWYVNGVLGKEEALTGLINTGSGAFLIGREVPAGNGFRGTLDELAVYPTALSAARIAAHYFAGTQFPEPVVAASGAMPRAGHKHPAIRIGSLA